MDAPRPNLRLVETSPWNEAASFDERPNLYDSIDQRVRQIQLEIYPRIGWFQLSFMALVAVFIGFCVAAAL